MVHNLGKIRHWFSRHLPVRIVPLCLLVVIAGCTLNSGSGGGPASTASATSSSSGSVTSAAEHVVNTATAISDGRAYSVELKMYKSSPLHPFKTLWSEEPPQASTIPVAATTYQTGTPGKQLAASGFGANLIFKGELSQYVVKVVGRSVVDTYEYVDQSKQVHPISAAVYALALRILPYQGNLTTATVNAPNATVTYLVRQALSALKFTSVTPLVHYWVKVQIGNQSFTGNVTTLIRNALNHETITLEVPQAVYNAGGNLWNPSLNPGALLLRGHLSELHGTIVQRWIATDPNLVMATLSTGQTLIVPRGDLPS